MPIPAIDCDTAERQTLVEIRDWYVDMADALSGQRASVLTAILLGRTFASRFVGMTEADVETWYDRQRRELERLTMLNLVASAEATLKVDYFRRVGQRLKNPLARAYQKWHKGLSPQKQLRPDFDDRGILHVLKSAYVMDNNIIGQYRECLRARHWVGHGRYWEKPVEVDSFDPDEVYDRASALLRAMPY